MNRRPLYWILVVAGVAALLTPNAARAACTATNLLPTDPLYCTVGYNCNIETRLASGNLCTDTCDNDGNGSTDAVDMHCQSEVLCEDGFDNDAGGGTDGADSDCLCMDGAYGSETVCTANDLAISYTASPIVGDGCINSSDSLIAQLFAQITLAQADRYNLGLWVNLNGGSAKTGTLCTRQSPQPVSATPNSQNPAGTGPFHTLDGNACGDGPTASVSLYKFPFNVDVPCSDITVTGESLQNGFIDLGQCGSWDNNAGGCSNPGNTLPNTKSKCRCARAESSIPGPNFRTVCTNFPPTGLGANGTLDTGETASFSLDYTNAVSNCTPGTGGNPFGRARCGTASFVRIVVTYPSTLNGLGDFYYNDGASDVEIPVCTTAGVLGSSQGVVCNDTTNNRLIFAPQDSNTTNLAVISAFAGTRSLPFKYTLTGDPPGTDPTPFTFAAAVHWDNDLDTNPVDGSLSASEALDLTGALLQTCADCACSTTAQATPITLSSFHATPSGRAVQFDWTTETEAGNVGFNLYSLGRGGKQKLNDQPIPTASSSSLEPQSYRVTLAVPDGARRFEIEDLDLRGRSRSHGPFDVDKQYGSKVVVKPVDWGDVRRENGAVATTLARDLGRPKGRARVAEAAAAVAAGPIELDVATSGLYRVTYEQLLAAGFDLKAESSAQLGLTVAGTPVPIFVNSGAKFGPGSSFDFWGEALDTIYTRTNVYRLATGQRKPARAATSSALPSGAAATSYPETGRFERDRDYAVWSSADDPFFDTEMLVFSSPGYWLLDFPVDGYVPAGGSAILRAEVFGGTAIDTLAPDHKAQFLVNGVMVGEITFDGFSRGAFQGAIPAGALVEGANQLVVKLPGDTGAPYDLMELDHFSVTYPRAFIAQSGALDFSAQSGRFEVSGLPDTNAVAYRRDGTALTRLTGVSVAPFGGGFKAVVPGSNGNAKYAVASAGGLLAPGAIRAVRPLLDIKTGPATYLIVANAAFLDGIAPLAAARAAQGLAVKVVDVEDIYAQFGHGVFGAEAIQRYIAYAYGSMGTKYVLLAGGDSYDYLDDLGLGSVSFVPALYRATGDIVHWAPSDSAYADVDGDGVQDLAIGRLPVRTPQELDAAVTKTLQYGAKSYVAVGAFAADHSDAGANESFATASDRLIDKLPNGWQTDRVYLGQLTLAQARTNLFADIAAGAALTSYVGHSGLSSWGSSVKPVSQHLFTINDVAALTNSGAPTFVSQLGCWNTYFPSPRIESLGARLLLIEDRGAAAVLGASTLSEDANGNRFGALVTPLFTAPGARVGDAVVTAKRLFAQNPPPNADFRDVLLGWTLLGDPALQVTP